MIEFSTLNSPRGAEKKYFSRRKKKLCQKKNLSDVPRKSRTHTKYYRLTPKTQKFMVIFVPFFSLDFIYFSQKSS